MASDLPSNFALKIHALLRHPYIKGRDWYDFAWYVAKAVRPNLQLLENALFQAGPWKGDATCVDPDWLLTALREKIDSVDWGLAAEDVSRFPRPLERASLQLWSARFFFSKLSKLEASLR